MKSVIIAFCLCFPGLLPAQDKTSVSFDLLPPPATNTLRDYVMIPAPVPTRHICLEDIEPGSIESHQFSTNFYVIRFTYTEVGAQQMLAFRREHAGHKVLIKVGTFERLAIIAPLEIRPPGWTEEGWLKRRTDKFFGVSEEDAQKIVAGLKKI